MRQRLLARPKRLHPAPSPLHLDACIYATPAPCAALTGGLGGDWTSRRSGFDQADPPWGWSSARPRSPRRAADPLSAPHPGWIGQWVSSAAYSRPRSPQKTREKNRSGTPFSENCRIRNWKKSGSAKSASGRKEKWRSLEDPSAAMRALDLNADDSQDHQLQPQWATCKLQDWRRPVTAST